MTAEIKLDPRLRQDTYHMGLLKENYLLLSKNSLYPWFILVPATNEIEFYKLTIEFQEQLLEQINKISTFIETHFNSTKLNIATIGNVVSQLHIHIIGRNPDDACWPGVVWGNEQFRAYQEEYVIQIQQELREYFGEEFIKI